MLENALSINPNLVNAQNWLNTARAQEGDGTGAMAIIDKLIELDPLYGPALSNAVQMYNKRGKQNKSWALLKRVKPFSQNQIRVLHSEAATHISLGQYARGLPLMDIVFQEEPSNHHFRGDMSKAWNSTHQFERSVRDATKTNQSFALLQLGRVEEALIAAYEIADAGTNIDAFFNILNALGKSDNVIKILDERWNGLENVTIDKSGVTGCIMLNEIALAYKRSGDLEKSGEALRLVRQGHDRMIDQGWSNFDFSLNEAVYHALIENAELALEHLSDAVDKGYIGSTRIAMLKPAFEPLEEDPQFEAIQARMIIHLNEEREALGLKPVAE